MRVKDFDAVDTTTKDFIVNETTNILKEKKNKIKFQGFFCNKTLPVVGVWDGNKRKCHIPPSFCDRVSEKKAKYYDVFEKDFGNKVWSTTVKPLLDELDICTSSATGLHYTYFRYLLVFHMLTTGSEMLKTFLI